MLLTPPLCVVEFSFSKPKRRTHLVHHITQVVLPPVEVGGPLLLVAGFPFGALQPFDIIFRALNVKKNLTNPGRTLTNVVSPTWLISNI